MIDLEQYLYDRIKPIIESWNEDGIYAVSFYVYSNEAYTYHGHTNVSEFGISYNTEKDCHHAPQQSEERWNFAFWRQNIEEIIIPIEDDEGMKVLFDWYAEQGIIDIGYEDFDLSFDADMDYIGKGPIGYYELLNTVSNVARKIQCGSILLKQFGKPIPVIVHDLEYSWYVKEATEHANPNGEASAFLHALQNRFAE